MEGLAWGKNVDASFIALGENTEQEAYVGEAAGWLVGMWGSNVHVIVSAYPMKSQTEKEEQEIFKERSWEITEKVKFKN